MSILSALLVSSSALNAYSRVLETTQNNVANASTPGYAKQTQSLDAVNFDLRSGGQGGVRAGAVQSSRDEYAEQAVRHESTLLGAADQDVASLSGVQSVFDISGNSGLPKALNGLFQAFSAWGQAPTDGSARQTVIDSAAAVATAFRQTATRLDSLTQDTNGQLQQSVASVNQLAGEIAQCNARIMAGNQQDAGLDAQVHAGLEQLSSLVPLTAARQPDGSFMVLMNGQTPLVMGAQTYGLSFQLEQPQDPPPQYPGGPPAAQILSSDGTDVTSGISTGQLGALLQMRNQVLPSYMGDSQKAGDLNTMAKQFATRVNQLLTSGVQPDGSAGTPLFLFGTGDGTNAARSISVDSNVTPGQLAAASPGPPPVANGVPLALSQLENPNDGADRIDGVSVTAFYGEMAARAGAALKDATGEQSVEQGAVAQAQNLRQQSSGVDLNEQAMLLVEFQRAYEANSKLITVLDQLSQDVIDMMR